MIVVIGFIFGLIAGYALAVFCFGCRLMDERGDYMRCPWCGEDQTRVTHTVQRAKETDMVHRRRKCEGCGRRFGTYEDYEAGVDYAGEELEKA